MKIPKRILPLIVIAQFCCTSLWFAGNGVMASLIRHFNLEPTALGHLTTAVQFGFICGTLFFAIFTLADRFSPSRVFFISAVTGAIFNLGVLIEGNTLFTLMAYRFFTGVFLAGIYPVGMKIAADYFEKGLGRSLGLLVGALVLGTAFPHILAGYGKGLPWTLVIWVTSGLALAGGLLILLFVPNGPFRKRSSGLDLYAFFKVFRKPGFRAAAFGYFGHMWELYAFWAFVPFMIDTYTSGHSGVVLSTEALAFAVIGIGGPACVLSGYLSGSIGTKRIASISLASSCACCLFSPLVFVQASPALFVAFLLFWGITVVSDSPLFSTMVAQNSLAEVKGTALTIVNCIGFAITIISIQLLNFIREVVNLQYLYVFLALGPILGLMALFRISGHNTVN
jgi:MFS family permease